MTKNFNKLEVGEWYQTIDGILVRIHFIYDSPEAPYLFYATNGLTYTSDGRCYHAGGVDNPQDLVLNIEAPVVRPKQPESSRRGRVLFKSSSANCFHITPESYTEAEFRELISDQSVFVCVLDENIQNV